MNHINFKTRVSNLIGKKKSGKFGMRKIETSWRVLQELILNMEYTIKITKMLELTTVFTCIILSLHSQLFHFCYSVTIIVISPLLFSFSKQKLLLQIIIILDLFFGNKRKCMSSKRDEPRHRNHLIFFLKISCFIIISFMLYIPIIFVKLSTFYQCF